MSDKIMKNIALAFAEESRVSAQMSPFILKAEQEGFTKLARLFKAVENAKSIHVRRFLLLMRGKIKNTEENLKAALQNEVAATNDLYPKMVEDAKEASKVVKKAFAQSMKTAGEYADLYQEAMKDMLTESDTLYYVCQICGHIHENVIPDKCPVCRAVPGRFKKVL
jgi:rubrerythrin